MQKKHDHTQISSATDIVLCHFRSFFALLPNYWLQKLKLGKNVKTTRRHYPFTHVYSKSWSYHVWFLRFKVQRTEFFVILGHFLPFDPPNKPQNQNFEKQKNTWRYYHFMLVYHKWQLHDVLFLRYQVQQTEFCHFGLFFVLLPP